MNALDTYIPMPQREADKPFLMSVEDVFSIKGRGTVATGRVERGRAKVGDEVEIIGLTKENTKTVITGIEQFNKTCETAEAGDNVGCLLRGVEREGIERGQVLAKPGSITPHTKFEANIYVLTGEEGGRKTPFFARLQAAVLLPHDGRDRRHHRMLPPTAKGRNVHARRQRQRHR